MKRIFFFMYNTGMKRLCAFLFIMIASMCGDAFAFYCGNEIVAKGDTTGEVVLKCGDPSWKYQHTEKIVEGQDTGFEVRNTVIIDEWLYNRGPLEFMRFLKFRNGRLNDIDELGYGFSRGSPPPACDHGRALAVGDTIIEVVMKCGEPLSKETRTDEVREQIDIVTEHRVYVTIEEWTYNFGPLHFLYLLRFENGKLVDIKTRGYGK